MSALPSFTSEPRQRRRSIRPWMEKSEGMRILGCTRGAFEAMAESGAIRARTLPGYGRPEYLRSDIERIAAQSAPPLAATP